MLGVKKGLKYIKVKGRMTACGEYDTSSVWVRPYEAVTFMDEAGVELHFRLLFVPKRIDDNVQLDQPATFYILRFKNKDQYIGAVYAVDLKNEKSYYLDDARKVVKLLARSVSFRGQIFGEPVVFAVVIAVGGFLIGALMSSILGTFLGAFAAVAWGAFLLYPIIWNGQYAGVEEMEGSMRLEGFKVEAHLAAKY